MRYRREEKGDAAMPAIDLIYIKSIKPTLAVCSKTKHEEIVYPKYKQTHTHAHTCMASFHMKIMLCN